ncbi:DHA2 family efflux MFS transporter permease subunit [Amycolatopsis thermoflava]|uniref:DHA2 family efflux MFS transporter permease subunit n=1 Tax=Amycolatopsis thermoflava TaxID=84480 RepID=UPI0012F89943|nr:DHA2 family efflux MFS transporter permease subunit [Amycolatopsis thermoflava]
MVSLGAAMVALDGTVISVANPALSAELDASLTDLQWVTNGYLLAIATTLVIFGKAADRFSRKGFWLTGVVAFTAASVLVGLAPSVELVIVWRVAQGLAGALIMPAGVGLLRGAFAGAALSRALAVWSTSTAGAAAAGPVIAGLLVESYGWEAVFFINAPIGVIAIGLGLHHLPRTPKRQADGRLDVLGAVLLAAAMMSLVWAVLEIEKAGSAGTVLLFFALAATLTVVFSLREGRAKEPVLDLRIFRNRTVPAAALLVVLAFFTLYGTLFFVTLYLQRVRGADAVGAGVQVLPLTVALGVASALVGRLNARFGPRPALLAGTAAIALSALGLSQLETGTGYAGLWPWLVGMGAGVGLVSVASTEALVGNVDQRLSSVAGGLQQTASQLGGVLGTAVLSTVVSSSVQSRLPRELAATGVHGGVAEAVAADADKVAQGIAPVPPGANGALTSRITDASHEAFLAGMSSALLVAMGAALAGLVAALFVRPGVTVSRDEVVVMH